MFFGDSKISINSIFCDYQSLFHPKDDIFEMSGYKWPDDFEEAEPVGSARFQVITDFKSGLCLFNHKGNLYPFTEIKILERTFKIKESVVIERFGKHNPFQNNNVYLLETGFNYGNIEYIVFDYNKEKCNSSSSFRKVLYSFPLFWLIQEIVELKKQADKKGFHFDLEQKQKLENAKILNHDKLKEWQFMNRDFSPDVDKYREIVECPLRDYYFQRNNQVDIWLKFKCFEA